MIGSRQAQLKFFLSVISITFLLILFVFAQDNASNNSFAINQNQTTDVQSHQNLTSEIINDSEHTELDGIHIENDSSNYSVLPITEIEINITDEIQLSNYSAPENESEQINQPDLQVAIIPKTINITRRHPKSLPSRILGNKTIKFKEIEDFERIEGYLPIDEKFKYGQYFDEVAYSNGARIKKLYTSTRNVFEDGKWKRIEKVESLKDKGILKVEYLEQDPNYDFEIIDYNWNSIVFKPVLHADKLNQDIPVKVDNEIKNVINFKQVDDKDLNIFRFEFEDGILGKKLTVGNQSTTILLVDYNGDFYCNQVNEDTPNTPQSSTQPGIYTCDSVDDCDTNEDQRAWIQFDAGFNLEDIILEDAELSLFIAGEGGTYGTQADGDIEIRRSNSAYNPSSLTWNNQPSTTYLTDYDDLDYDETVQLISTDLSGIDSSFIGNTSSFLVYGLEDTDNIFEGELHCNSDFTYLAITYTQCNPSDPCCNENSNYKPAGSVCNALHNFTCSSKTSSGCSGFAYEDRCDGLSGSCPDNNYQVFYPAACNGQVCVSESCAASQYQPIGVCQDTACVYPSQYSCPSNLICTGNACIESCTSNNDCISGYSCDITTGACYLGNATTLQYDSVGNLKKDLNYNYTYNQFNQLTSIRNSQTGSLLEQYSYDENGQRIKKVTFQGGGLNTTTYYIDGSYVKIFNSSGNYDEKYFYLGPELLGKFDANDNWLFFHNDHLGSPYAITDSNGAFVETISYKPFGELISSSKERYQYEGKELDASELYYFNARYYDPSNIIRFTQPDQKIQDPYDPQALNRYAFERNNPYGYTDPDGQTFWDAVDVGLFALDVKAYNENPSLENFGWAALSLISLTPVLPNIAGYFRHGEEAVQYGNDALDAAGKFFNRMDRITEAQKLVTRASKQGFAPGKLQTPSHLKHATELGLSTDGYQEAAKRFVSSENPDIITHLRTSGDFAGDIMRYNPKTNEFSVVSKEGYIRTYYKPQGKLGYYEKQIKNYGGERIDIS